MTQTYLDCSKIEVAEILIRFLSHESAFTMKIERDGKEHWKVKVET